MGRCTRYRNRVAMETGSVEAKGISGMLSRELRTDFGLSKLESEILASRSIAWLQQRQRGVLPGQVIIDAPATACSQRPSDGSFSLLSPAVVSATAATMVISVTRPNTSATATTSQPLCCAAGYINRGIKASHGPSTKMMNIAQGVIEARDGSSWTCRWSRW